MSILLKATSYLSDRFLTMWHVRNDRNSNPICVHTFDKLSASLCSFPPALGRAQRLRIVFLLFLLLAYSIYPQEAKVAEESFTSKNVYEGYVLEAKTKRGIENATVEMKNQNLGVGYYSVKTDSKGYFIIKDFIPEINYKLSIQASGYVNFTSEGSIQQTKEKAKYFLAKEGILQGVVKDSRGKNLEGVEVKIKPDNYYSNSYKSQTTTTNAKGYYKFEKLTEGSYSVSFEKSGRISETARIKKLNSAKAKMNSLQSALFKANQTFVNGKGTSDPDTDDPTYIQQRADWLQAEADYNNQANVIKQAEAALASAWLSYAQLSPTITAPMSGTVKNLSITPGLTISGSSSTSSNGSTTDTNTGSSQTVGVITLENGTPQASVNLTEIDVVKVKPGQKVTLTLDSHPDKTFTGKVSAVNTNGSVSSGVTTYPTTITFDTAVDTIYPNMAVNATIITDVENNVILVPSGAIQTSNGTSSVRVMKNGQPTSVQVEIGGSNDTQTKIISGISEGDTIVTGQTGGTTSKSTGTTTSPFGNTRGGFGGGFSGPPGGGR
jgi:macrolide-specific efflux system membrane fusion protein